MSLSEDQPVRRLAMSFYRPMDYFGGMYNRLVTWFTSGEFCHCELVVETTPSDIMDAVKSIYQSAQNEEYPPADCQRIITQIELKFFDTAFRKAAQTSDSMVLSFSLLWGQPMTVRVLNETSHDSWFKIPSKQDRVVSLMHGPDVTIEHYQETLKFAIEELGKEYDSTGAICSVLPSWSAENSNNRRESYFCSEFCVMAFQRVGFMKNLSAKHTTPNSLYKYVQQNFLEQNS
jgi:hypothetical protein